MNNTHSFYFLKRKLSRPSTSRSLSSSKVQLQPSLEITAKRLIPQKQKPAVSDMGTSPMIFDSEFQFVPNKKKIVVVKGQKNTKESPSIMISDDIVSQYLKCEPSIKFKKKCPLNFLAIPLPGSSLNRMKTDRFSSSSRSHLRFLNREQSLKNKMQKPMRMFDYNEVVSATHLNIRMK